MVVVDVPYSDRSGTKRRPALVVSAEGFHRALPDVVICPVSSQPRYYQQPGPGDHPLRHWKAAGLRHPSTVRDSTILALEKILITRILGASSADDLDRVLGGLRRAFGL